MFFRNSAKEHPMSRFIAVTGLSLLIASNSAWSSDRSIEALWQLVESQQAQINQLTDELDATRSQLSNTRAKARITEEQLDVTASYVEQALAETSDSRLSIGGYGEMHYNNLDANDSDNDLKEVDFHRFVTFMNYDFTDRIRLVTEVEIEHALTKDTADGSNTGEVEVEQAYIEYDLSDQYFARTGLFLLPIGILNETHEPPTFYGVERNNVESILIPSTGWEGGASIGGRYSNGISWDFAVTSGLDMPTDGSSAYRVRSGRQKVSNAAADDLAYTGRVKYTGVPGLELSGSLHYQTDPTQGNGGDLLDEGLLVSTHGIYTRGPFSLRALWAQWNFDGEGIEAADVDQQTGWYIEPSVKVRLLSKDWGFYTRYEDVEGGRDRDQFDQWELGFNFYPTDNVVLKFDYRDREHDMDSESGRDFSGFDLGVGYQF
jgi:opacity protein-like surface antigen